MKPAPHEKREQDPVPLLGAVANGVDAGRQERRVMIISGRAREGPACRGVTLGPALDQARGERRGAGSRGAVQ